MTSTKLPPFDAQKMYDMSLRAGETKPSQPASQASAVRFADDDNGHRAAYSFATFIEGMATEGNPAASELLAIWENFFLRKL